MSDLRWEIDGKDRLLGWDGHRLVIAQEPDGRVRRFPGWDAPTEGDPRAEFLRRRRVTP